MSNEVEYWNNLAKHGPIASVIDPNDKLGNKNNYISFVRSKILIDSLKDCAVRSMVLDFGCGTGVFSCELDRKGYRPYGIDIAHDLLCYAIKREYPQVVPFVQYDGLNIPFVSKSFHACVTYSVLIYLVEDSSLDAILKEIYRVLSQGSLFIAVEQVRRRRILSENGMKIQRSQSELIRHLEFAGFHSIKTELIRRGHFPFIYLVRYGILSAATFPFLLKIERFFGRYFPQVLLDYADVKFTCTK